MEFESELLEDRQESSLISLSTETDQPHETTVDVGEGISLVILFVLPVITLIIIDFIRRLIDRRRKPGRGVPTGRPAKIVCSDACNLSRDEYKAAAEKSQEACLAAWDARDKFQHWSNLLTALMFIGAGGLGGIAAGKSAGIAIASTMASKLSATVVSLGVTVGFLVLAAYLIILVFLVAMKQLAAGARATAERECEDLARTENNMWERHNRMCANDPPYCTTVRDNCACK